MWNRCELSGQGRGAHCHQEETESDQADTKLTHEAAGTAFHFTLTVSGLPTCDFIDAVLIWMRKKVIYLLFN